MEINQTKLVNLFLELIKIDGVSLNERAIADHIIKKLHAWKLPVEEDDTAAKINGNCGNLIVRVPGIDDEHPLLIMAHLDTVTSTAQLKPIIKDGTISSSGDTILGADDRSGVAVILYVLESILSDKQKHRSLEIVFSVAEELGMFGATHLNMEKLRASEGYVLDCSREVGCYVASTVTAIDFKVDFYGRAAHSGVAPEKGINAISMAAEILNNFPVGRLDQQTVANIGTIQGGVATNVVPDKVTITGEFRSFDDEKIKNIQQKLEQNFLAVTQKYNGRIEPSFTIGFKGFKLGSEQPVVKVLETKLSQMGIQVQPLDYYGGSDANVINARGITVANLGMSVKNPHAHSEQIAINDLVSAAELVMRLIEAEE